MKNSTKSEMPDQDACLNPDADHAWRHRMKTTLLENIFDPDLSVRWLANRLHLSERQFCRKTLRQTGHSPVTIIREAKLQTAHQLLRNGEKTMVKNVALALHFKDIKYFSRLFHRRFGYYPSALIRPKK